MNPKVVSTRALGEFLIRATKLGQGTAYGEMKYQEFSLWVNTQGLIFTKEKLRDSYEYLRRLLREKLKVLEHDELSHDDHKACCKAIHTMIVRSEQKGKLERNFDDEIFNCFLTALKVDKTDSIMETFSLLNDGFSAAMKQVVINPMRNMNLFVERPPTLRALPLKEGSTTKPKDSSSPSPSPAPRSKSKDPSNNNSKKDSKRRSESPHPRSMNNVSFDVKDSKEEEKPLCPGCGRLYRRFQPISSRLRPSRVGPGHCVLH
jgi:hypothetical protein